MNTMKHFISSCSSSNSLKNASNIYGGNCAKARCCKAGDSSPRCLYILFSWCSELLQKIGKLQHLIQLTEYLRNRREIHFFKQIHTLHLFDVA